MVGTVGRTMLRKALLYVEEDILASLEILFYLSPPKDTYLNSLEKDVEKGGIHCGRGCDIMQHRI